MDCVCTLDDILRCLGGTNAPGIRRMLSIACFEEVASIPSPAANTHEITANIVMRAAAAGPPAVDAGKFHKWSFSPEEATYNCPQDENGLYNIELKIFVEKMDKKKTYTFSGLSGDNYIVLFEDMNKGGMRLLGDEDSGAKINVKETTNPKNGYEVTITWKSNALPYWYTGTVTY